MKAVIYEKYGSPDVLQIREIDKPSVADDEVLVKVHAASIQQTDTNFRSGTPFLARVIARARARLMALTNLNTIAKLMLARAQLMLIRIRVNGVDD